MQSEEAIAELREKCLSRVARAERILEDLGKRAALEDLRVARAVVEELAGLAMTSNGRSGQGG